MYQHEIAKYLKYRVLTQQDLESVLQIERATYPFPWTEGIFKDCLESTYDCLAIELHDQLIGYVILSLVLDEAHLLNICISDNWRKQGIGKASLYWLFDFLTEKKINSLFLEVRPSNQNALNLYTQLGFEEIGLRKDYYPSEPTDNTNGREDALVMQKALEPGSK